MYSRILLCYDGSIEGRRALRQGGEVALAMQARVHMLAICRSMVSTSVPEGVTPQLVECEERTARSLLEEGVEIARSHGIEADGTLVFGQPIDEIPRAAKEFAADLVVLSYRPRSRLARWWSQSDEETLLQRLSCSILVTMASAEE